MAHIQLEEGLPGVRGLMAFRPETAQWITHLVDTLLTGTAEFPAADRELMAMLVSHWEGCHYSELLHAAVATAHLAGNEALVQQVLQNYETAPITDKLKSLLAIAQQALKNGKNVTDAHIQRARDAGAGDLEIHDTVLITGLYCLFDRYIDGLGTWSPKAAEFYKDRGARIAQIGYNAANRELTKIGK